MIWMPGYRHYSQSALPSFINNHSLLMRGATQGPAPDYKHLDGGTCLGWVAETPSEPKKKFTYSVWMNAQSYGTAVLSNNDTQQICGTVIEMIHADDNWLHPNKLTIQKVYSSPNNTILEVSLLFMALDTNFIESGYTYRYSGSAVSMDSDGLDEWHHIVVHIDTTEDDENDRVKIFINGIDTNAAPEGPENVIPKDGEFVLGGSATIGPMLLVGSIGTVIIDEVSFFNGSIVPVSSLASNGKPKDLDGLFTDPYDYWLRFETGDIDTIGVDSSGNGNHFTEVIKEIGIQPPYFETIPFEQSDVKDDVP